MTTQPRETASILASLGDREDLTYAQTILWAAVIGVAGGLVATAYYDVMEACLHWVWYTFPAQLQSFRSAHFAAWNYVWVVTTLGGSV